MSANDTVIVVKQGIVQDVYRNFPLADRVFVVDLDVDEASEVVPLPLQELPEDAVGLLHWGDPDGR